MNTIGSTDVVVVTGSRGIGGRVAARMAKAGASVAILYHSQIGAAEALVHAIEQADGRAIAIRADIAIEADIIDAFEQVDRFGSLVGLVNSAAITGERAQVSDVTYEQLEKTWSTNISGPFICCREAIRRMSTSRGGRGGAIVNISSIAARRSSPNMWVHYAASKAALETMSVGLAQETATHGIRVNVVRPGLIDTDMHSGHGEDRKLRLMAQIPMGRMGTPDEIADLVEFLLSERSSYVTGAVIEAGGGM